MERNYDEVIADMLIQLDQLERRMDNVARRFEAFDFRMNLTVKRMVKVEQGLEIFDKRIEQFVGDQRQFKQEPSELNIYFLDYIKKNSFEA